MTTREFIQHLILNGELDDHVEIEVHASIDRPSYISLEPAHVTHLEDHPSTTLIECKPYKGDA